MSDERLDALEKRVTRIEAGLGLRDPLQAMDEAISKLKPMRPEGEENDRHTVTRVREELSHIFLDVFDESLEMRPTLELIDIMGQYLRQWKPKLPPFDSEE